MSKEKHRFQHSMKIPRGTQGELDKIKEEYYELTDAHHQNDYLFKLVETSDLMYAIARYSWKQLKIPFVVMCFFTGVRQIYKLYIRKY